MICHLPFGKYFLLSFFTITVYHFISIFAYYFIANFMSAVSMTYLVAQYADGKEKQCNF